MIRGIHHISMKCSSPAELSAARAFYCDLLGLPVVREWPEGIMIGTGTCLIEIFGNGEGTGIKGAIRHLAFAVDDVDACADLVRAAGYPVFSGPKEIVFASDPPLRARVAFCTGPLGEEVELFCDLSGSPLL